MAYQVLCDLTPACSTPSPLTLRSLCSSQMQPSLFQNAPCFSLLRTFTLLTWLISTHSLELSSNVPSSEKLSLSLPQPTPKASLDGTYHNSNFKAFYELFNTCDLLGRNHSLVHLCIRGTYSRTWCRTDAQEVFVT